MPIKDVCFRDNQLPSKGTLISTTGTSVCASQYFSPPLPTGHAPPHNLNLSPRGSQSESMITLPSIQSESNLLALSQAKKLKNFPPR
ncbi:hypothetical protein TNCV_1020521 [Trichonephila clavipes]|nr:hypothetical protein TNCV_1020521 [Trichonephila clavipes]